MRKDFNLVRRETPILEDPAKSKNGIYEIRDNFLSFWYYFVDKRRDYIEQERFPEIISQFNRDFPLFVGRKFEKFIIGLIKEGIIPIEGKYEKIGRQWGKIESKAAAINSNQVYEIDILMENPQEQTLFIGECKWQDNVNAVSLVNGMIKKRGYLPARYENFKDEIYLVFARNFSKEVDYCQGKRVRCFSLDTLDRLMTAT